MASVSVYRFGLLPDPRLPQAPHNARPHCVAVLSPGTKLGGVEQGLHHMRKEKMGKKEQRTKKQKEPPPADVPMYSVGTRLFSCSASHPICICGGCSWCCNVCAGGLCGELSTQEAREEKNKKRKVGGKYVVLRGTLCPPFVYIANDDCTPSTQADTGG